MVTTIVVSFLAAATVGAAKPAADAPLLSEDQLQQAGFRKFWEANLPLIKGDALEEGYLVDEALYVTTVEGSVYALKADVGLLRWGAGTTKRDYKIFPPTHVQTADGAGPVVIPTTTEIFVFDRFLGEVIQRFTPEFATGSAAVAYDHRMFIGSAGDRFYSLIFNHPRLDKPFKRWEVQVGGPVTAAPVLYGRGNLLFASQTGTVYSCRAADKALNWSYRTGGPIFGDPAVDAGGVYVASSDRSLYKLHSGIGRVMWRARFPRPLLDGPVVVAETVYQHCPDHGLTALDAATGAEKWRHAEGRLLAAHSAAGDVVFTTDRRIDVVDHETGEVFAVIDAQNVITPVVNTLDDAVFLLGTNGRVVCLRLDEVPYLRRQQVNAARRRLNLPPADEAAVRDRPEQNAGKPSDSTSDPLRSRRDKKP